MIRQPFLLSNTVIVGNIDYGNIDFDKFNFENSNIEFNFELDNIDSKMGSNGVKQGGGVGVGVGDC
jgi:hypothetical protein